jgi:predicted TIM-barrel fold metal-dependent hydrolase
MRAMSLRLFDAYTIMGTATRPPLQPALEPQDLLAEMDRCGVDEAMVTNAGWQIASVPCINRQVVEWCAASPRLHPVWCILPNQCGEMEPAALFRDMKRHGVRLLQARPGAHRYLLNGITCGPLLEELVARRIPLMLDSDWPLLTALLTEFPKLTVLAVEHGCWGSDRYFRPLLEEFANFHIDTANYELDGGIPALVRKYGAERIIYGSSFHNRPMGGASLLLRNVDIDPASRELIAHGNLERLLKGVRL